MRLSFYGAAGGEVTGSNYLLEVGDKKFLIDCGMFQGGRDVEEKNSLPFPYDPESIEAVFVTHTHVDHIGRLPKLVKDGFRGKIYSTAPAKDMAEPILEDAVHIFTENHDRFGKPVLYGEDDVSHTLLQWQAVTYRKPLIIDGLKVTFHDAGHILGSSFIVFEAEGKILVFSGDLGNTPELLVEPTEYITKADYCVIESTYGGSVHEPANKRQEILKGVIKETVRKGGVLMIPAFAMERTQDLIYELNYMVENHMIPKVQIFVDSPLAIKLTDIYRNYTAFFNNSVKKLIASGDDIFDFRGLHFTPTADESKAINDVPAPKIIVASSGMSEGGRILHHEKRYLSDAKNTILIVGYQPSHSLGGKIMRGAGSVKILGEMVNVNARVRFIDSYSAHADQPLLLRWLKPMSKSIKKIFVTHGENEEQSAFIKKINDDFDLVAEAPQMGSTYDII